MQRAAGPCSLHKPASLPLCLLPQVVLYFQQLPSAAVLFDLHQRRQASVGGQGPAAAAGAAAGAAGVGAANGGGGQPPLHRHASDPPNAAAGGEGAPLLPGAGPGGNGTPGPAAAAARAAARALLPVWGAPPAVPTKRSPEPGARGDGDAKAERAVGDAEWAAGHADRRHPHARRAGGTLQQRPGSGGDGGEGGGWDAPGQLKGGGSGRPGLEGSALLLMAQVGAARWHPTCDGLELPDCSRLLSSNPATCKPLPSPPNHLARTPWSGAPPQRCCCRA
jgi:hypothetical protein